MKRVVILIVPLFLAACGADGPPVPPSKAAAQGLAATGEVQVGVASKL